MSDDLRANWDELVEHVLAEYVADHRTIFLNFYHDFDQRTIRLRVLGPHPDWVVQTVPDDQLRSGDLRGIAAVAYAETRSD